MKNAIKLSIIVPVYKVKENLLRNCIESMLNQNSFKVEFIIVDDGSPDNCGKICDEYKDERLKVFHKENGGVSSARNYGLSVAKGKYIMFVDGDDCLEKNVLDIFIRAMEESDDDVIFFKYRKINENNEMKELDTVECIKFTKLDSEDIASVIVSNNEKSLNYDDVCFGSPWGKIFKKEYLDKYKFLFPLGIKKSQDRIFMLKVMSQSPKLHLINVYGYIYIENDTSICQAYNPNIVKILNEALQEFKKVINTYYEGDMQKKLYKDFNYLQYDFLYNMLRLFYFNQKNEYTKKMFHEYIDLCKDKRQYYINCKCYGMGKKKKLILIFLKTKLYRSIYFIMKKIVRMN